MDSLASQGMTDVSKDFPRAVPSPGGLRGKAERGKSVCGQWALPSPGGSGEYVTLISQASNSLARNKHEKCSFRDNARKFEVKQVQGMEGEMSGEGETKGALPLMVPLPRH